MGGEVAAVAAVMGRIAYLGEAYGSDYVQAYAATPTERSVLEALGFRARRSRVDASLFPADGLAGDPEELAFSGYDSDYGL